MNKNVVHKLNDEILQVAKKIIFAYLLTCDLFDMT